MRQGKLEEAQLAADALEARVSNEGLPGDGSEEEEESDLEIGQPGRLQFHHPVLLKQLACNRQGNRQSSLQSSLQKLLDLQLPKLHWRSLKKRWMIWETMLQR